MLAPAFTYGVHDFYQSPNLIIAGTIASGKTQFIYNQLVLWLFLKHPAEIKFVICRSKPIDYNAIALVERHFLAKLPSASGPLVDNANCYNTITDLNIECVQRLDLFSRASVKNIREYNAKFIARRLNPEEGHRYMPDIVLVMDDLYDFLHNNTVQQLIELTRKNLYTGVYVMVTTSQIQNRQITPQLRANFSLRVAFKLMAQNESSRILDRIGAEKLNAPGELLYEFSGRMIKGQQPYIGYDEIRNITEFIEQQRGYPSAYLLPEYVSEDWGPGLGDIDLVNDRDALFEDAARLIVLHQESSTSLIQRKLKLGYNRAGRIIDQLEAAGIVGPFTGSKARKVLYPDEYSLKQFLETLGKKNGEATYRGNFHKKISLTDGQRRVREIANTLLKYYPFDASDKRDPLPELLLERMSADSTIISDRITGSDVEHTSLAKSYIPFLRSTANEIAPPPSYQIDFERMDISGRVTESYSSREHPIKSYEGGTCGPNATTWAILCMAGDELSTFQMRINFYANSRHSTVTSGGNHRALAHKLYGKAQFPEGVVTFYDDSRYDEMFNEVLLYLESEFEAAIFIFDQEDEVKELARTLKQQTRIKRFFLHYFAGCSEIRVPHINAAFREIKASGGLTPPSRLKQLFAKFFSRNNPTTESPLIKAYKEWAEQNPYS